MEKETGNMLDKFLLYCLAIGCPFVALIVAIIIDYGKNNDQILARIKVISLYEMFEYFIFGIAIFYGGINGLRISIIILFIFYIFLCGMVAYNKKDFISRGIALGILTNHYSLAIMQTSEASTAKTDNSKWPDFGLAAILMVVKVLYILGMHFFFKDIIILILKSIGKYTF